MSRCTPARLLFALRTGFAEPSAFAPSVPYSWAIHFRLKHICRLQKRTDHVAEPYSYYKVLNAGRLITLMLLTASKRTPTGTGLISSIRGLLEKIFYRDLGHLATLLFEEIH